MQDQPRERRLLVHGGHPSRPLLSIIGAAECTSAHHIVGIVPPVLMVVVVIKGGWDAARHHIERIALAVHRVGLVGGSLLDGGGGFLQQKVVRTVSRGRLLLLLVARGEVGLHCRFTR